VAGESHADSVETSSDLLSVVLDTSGLILEVGETKDEMYFNWYTQEQGDYEVRYRIQGQSETEASVPLLLGITDSNHTYCYRAKLTGLQIGATYEYEIYCRDESQWSQTYTFEIPENKEGLTFLVAGDAQIGAGDVEEDAASWAKTLEVGMQLAPEASFLISLGDQTDSTDESEAVEESLAFRSPTTLKSLPMAVNQGNHEAKNSLYARQYQREGKYGIEYEFLYDQVLFISLDCFTDDYASQANYLREVVKAHKAEWIVVTLHYSLFSEGTHVNDKNVAAYREYFAPIFSECGVDVVLSGHDHSYTRSVYMNGLKATSKTQGYMQRAEVLYLSLGSSTGNKMNGQNEEGAGVAANFLDLQHPMITVVEVRDSQMKLKVYDVETAELVDSCVITK
jgi:3',5'-cyclic AMP phosphodiesterase CpdA